MPNFNEDLTVQGKITTATGALTLLPGGDGWAWFHIDNGPANNRPIGRLRISGGVSPGDDEFISVLQDGRVGIGTANPRAKLEVNGDIFTTGDVMLQNEDCAEDFDVVTSAHIVPGTVVTLNDEGKLEPSSRAYDTRVVGVVSGAGSHRPGLILGRQVAGANRLPIALIGKVCCRVDADPSPIFVGDLLTTAGMPGCAMKALDRTRVFGAVIGKALTRLDAGQGLIPVLVALQ